LALTEAADSTQLGFEGGLKSAKQEILEILIHGRFRFQYRRTITESGRSVNNKIHRPTPFQSCSLFSEPDTLLFGEVKM
jgi:hypothetical protein